ncbi:MAG TPA: flavodoxin family protein [Candidatus Thermoplasmatota archaeon]|nr:flavodoxin family protein [Candidatus Thermoplasmatota archaeon]
MKALAINGSARKNGNTAILINEVFKILKKHEIECEMIQLAGCKINGCNACNQCYKLKNNSCFQKDDIVNQCIKKMIEADIILLGSPTYFSNVTTEMKALIDRAGRVGRANDNAFKHKIGAAIVAVRRAGAIDAFNAINHFFLIEEMIIPGSIYWNTGIGKDIGDVKSDDEGVKNMRNLGENIAWLLNKIKAENE